MPHEFERKAGRYGSGEERRYVDDRCAVIAFSYHIERSQHGG